MRGSALRVSSFASNPRAPRVLAGVFNPVHPDQEEALPLAGPPARGHFAPVSPDRGGRPLGTRARAALLPETPARKLGCIPIPLIPRVRCRP